MSGGLTLIGRQAPAGSSSTWVQWAWEPGLTKRSSGSGKRHELQEDEGVQGQEQPAAGQGRQGTALPRRPS